MNKEENKNYISAYINGDSIIQIKDGRLLAYYFRKNDKISIYNQNTFQKDLGIRLNALIKKHEVKKKKVKKIKKVVKIKVKDIKNNDQEQKKLKESKGYIASFFLYISSFFSNITSFFIIMRKKKKKKNMKKKKRKKRKK